MFALHCTALMVATSGKGCDPMDTGNRRASGPVPPPYRPQWWPHCLTSCPTSAPHPDGGYTSDVLHLTSVSHPDGGFTSEAADGVMATAALRLRTAYERVVLCGAKPGARPAAYSHSTGWFATITDQFVRSPARVSAYALLPDGALRPAVRLG